MSKKFKLKSHELKNLAVGFGACIATDMITVHGNKVGYMYRDKPESPLSGWVFMAGNETQEYMDDASNISMYDINTIANYDPDIVSYIECAVGTECERNASGKLIKVSD